MIFGNIPIQTRQLMADRNLYNLLENHLPQNAIHYAYDLWAEHRFNFKVTRSRSSKNGDLNPYAFLVTYIHEVAHLVTYKSHSRAALPHGKEWRSHFRQLMLPMLSDLVFPKDILDPLTNHMRNPRATSSADHRLSAAL